jgi:hypothetical protein
MFGRSSLSKYALPFSVAFALGFLLLVPIAQPTFATSSQVTTTVNLQYFTIQAQYPSVVLPGNNTVVHLRGVAKSAVNLNNLVAYVYYVDGTSLHQLASTTLLGSQDVASGNTFTRDLPVTIPQGMARAFLFASFTESVKLSYVSSYSNPYSNYCYGYESPCSSYNCTSMQYCYNYNYPSPNSYSSYPQYSYYTTSDTGISPLSYVNATTPEYNNLFSQYQSQQQQLSQAQSQNQNLQQQVNQQNQQISQLQAQNQQLQQNLQTVQNAISQRDSDNSNLNSQLTAANTMNRRLTYLAGGFAILAVFAVLAGHRSGQSKKTQSVNPYAANYVPPQTQRPQTVHEANFN